jgi:hypothetical protein
MLSSSITMIPGHTCQPRRAARRLLLTLLLLPPGIAACAGRTPRPTASGAAPALVTGDFFDDYRGSFSISDTLWFQRPGNRFRIVEWHVSEQFLIAQNAADDPTAPNRWTRIDWLSLDGAGPYTWGFCLTAYQALTREAARDTPPAQRNTPKTGCNGFPFTRMKRTVNSIP